MQESQQLSHHCHLLGVYPVQDPGHSSGQDKIPVPQELKPRGWAWGGAGKQSRELAVGFGAVQVLWVLTAVLEVRWEWRPRWCGWRWEQELKSGK